jgi:hypothetical protein
MILLADCLPPEAPDAVPSRQVASADWCEVGLINCVCSGAPVSRIVRNCNEF